MGLCFLPNETKYSRTYSLPFVLETNEITFGSATEEKLTSQSFSVHFERKGFFSECCVH